MKKLFTTLAFLSLFATQASADCLVGHYNMRFVRDVSTPALSAYSGVLCAIPIRLTSKTWKTAGITDVILLAPPKHGTATTSLSGSVTYQSKAGYKGSDQFAVRFCISNPEKTRQRCSTLRYKVNVS
jgi:hypothetical protein